MNAARINHFSYQRGFTLVELVVSIVLSTIVVGFMALFITTPVRSYFAQARRAELVDEADIISRNIDNDIRMAVPNSVRGITTGNLVLLEMLETVDVANYRVKTPSGIATDELDFIAADAQFSTLGGFNRITRPFNSSAHYLVINNAGMSGQDAYESANVITPAGTTIDITAAPGVDHVTLGSAFKFSSPSLTHSVFLISGPVAYECNTATGALRRYAGYAIAVGIAANRYNAASNSLISRDIGNCVISVTPGNAQHAELVGLQVQLKRAVDRLPDETLSVFLQVPVENLP